jgi:hypothetical protein
VLALAATAFSAGVAGNWKGGAYRSDGTRTMDVVLVLKADAEKITGTVGPSPEEQIPITNAKLDADKLKFEVVTDEGVYYVDMTVAGDDLKGSAIRKIDGQESPPMKLELKRSN